MRWKIALAAALLGAFMVTASEVAFADASVIVQPGDTLSTIARRHGSSVGVIARANGLASVDLIRVGQRLTVPSAGVFAPPSVRVPGVSSSLHIVRPGETLMRIAVLYGTTVSAIARANGLSSPDRIYVGQRLSIPAATGDAPGIGPSPTAGRRGASGRGIVIDLSAQTLTALENGVPVRTFVVSTGKAGTPTPVGNFSIYNRYATQHMVGPGYSLPGVPYVQYFTGSYAIHGAYWHMSFGIPVSHGCVNMTVPDAGWLWSWAGIGTPVTVRY
jgi:lipoprotein-anchoring transpeptidase ErfK/SrfK